MSEPSIESVRRGPDPVYGAGLTIAGIVGMGIFGALGKHYAFNVSTGLAIVGAARFVLSIVLDARARR